VEDLEEFRNEIEPARAFAMDFIQVHEESQLLLKDVFHAWGSYAKNNGHEIKTDRNLSKVISEIYSANHKIKTRKGTCCIGLSMAREMVQRKRTRLT
jgi:hypothetical protein